MRLYSCAKVLGLCPVSYADLLKGSKQGRARPISFKKASDSMAGDVLKTQIGGKSVAKPQEHLPA
jgi:hypothetical protein